jgi:hypothetical protein
MFFSAREKLEEEWNILSLFSCYRNRGEWMNGWIDHVQQQVDELSWLLKALGITLMYDISSP